MKTEYAYTAGLIDGEGTVSLFRQGEFRYPIVSVSSTTYKLVRYMQIAYGGTLSTKRRKAKAHWKIAYQWAARGDRAIALLSVIIPYMLEPEKVRRAKLILSEYKDLTPRNGKYTLAMKAKKRRFEKKFFSKKIAV